MVGCSWDTWVTGQTMQFGYGFYDPPTHPGAREVKFNPCCGVWRRWRQSATLFRGGTSIKGLGIDEVTKVKHQ